MLADLRPFVDQLATRLVEGIYTNVNVAGALEQRLPEAQQGLAPVLAQRHAGALGPRRAATAGAAAVAGAVGSIGHRAARAAAARARRRSDGGRDRGRLSRPQPSAARRSARRSRSRSSVASANRLPGDAGYIRVMEADQLETAQDANADSENGRRLPLPRAARAGRRPPSGSHRGRRRSILLMLGVALVVVRPARPRRALGGRRLRRRQPGQDRVGAACCPGTPGTSSPGCSRAAPG